MLAVVFGCRNSHVACFADCLASWFSAKVLPSCPNANCSQKNVSRGQKAPKVTFSQILKSSVERETTSKGWCGRCQRYQTIATRKTIHNIPAVFMLNTAIGNSEQRRYWSTPGFLPEEIGVIVDHGQFFCYEGEDLKLHLQRGIHNITVYSLVGMAMNIDPGPGQKPHLVAMANGTLSSLLVEWRC